MVEGRGRSSLCCPKSVLSDQVEHTGDLWGARTDTGGFLMLCRHEILMVEETEEGGGEEAGSYPPGKEGEEALEKCGAENSPQAP